ncbi:MAG: fibronectin type III domain-containing protein [Armatimonadota bacterium]|nr:fibronectin type III domain-containing protein [Armatimonadota bacterium]
MRGLSAQVVVWLAFAAALGSAAGSQFPADAEDSQRVQSTSLSDVNIQFAQVCASPTANGDVVIRWVTNVPTTSKVEYGTTASYGKETPEDLRLVERHAVVLTDLQGDKLYHFRVCGSAGIGSPRFCSTDYTFFTLPPPSPMLLNGSFDERVTDSARSLYPWVQYTTGDETFGYNPIDGIVGPYGSSAAGSWVGGIKAFDGSFFLGAAAHWACKNGGVFQRVIWPPGERCTFSVRYAAFNRGGIRWDTRVRVGIDPEGGVDPGASSVRWWTAIPQTDDNKWYLASVSAVAGKRGIVTVFIDIRQRWELEWHVVAVDHATLTLPISMSVGALKASLGDFGVVLESKPVTFVSGEPTTSLDASYYKVYLEEPDRTAGIAVLFDAAAGRVPQIGEKATVWGSLVNHNLEAAVVAYDWTSVPSDAPLPAPLGISSKSVGGAGTAVQPSLFSGVGPCSVGLRVRVCGRVVWVDCSLPWWNATAVIDDGAAVANQLPPRMSAPRGLRVKLPGSSYGVQIGDYVIATGVLSIEFVDPKPPPYSGDEYLAYTVLVASPEDWTVVRP